MITDKKNNSKISLNSQEYLPTYEPLYIDDYYTDFSNLNDLKNHKLINEKVAEAFETYGDKVRQKINLDKPLYLCTESEFEEIEKHKKEMLKYYNRAKRLRECGGYLKFVRDDEGRLRLIDAHYCKVRACPVCQWRKSLKWKMRLKEVMPTLKKVFKKHKWIMLTLTVKNCELTELRKTIQHMQKSFRRLRELKKWPALGYIKSLEVTRSKEGLAHPHFHIIMLVEENYFEDPNKYIRYDEWSKLWQQCLRVNYNPIIDVRVIKSNKGNDVFDAIGLLIDYENKVDGAFGLEVIEEKIEKRPNEISFDGALSVLEYETKVTAMLDDPDFLVKATVEMAKLRSIELGGELKKYLADDEEGKMRKKREIEELKIQFKGREVLFKWISHLKTYKRTKYVKLPTSSFRYLEKKRKFEDVRMEEWLHLYLLYEHSDDKNWLDLYGPQFEYDLVDFEHEDSYRIMIYCKSHEDLYRLHGIKKFGFEVYPPVPIGIYQNTELITQRYCTNT